MKPVHQGPRSSSAVLRVAFLTGRSDPRHCALSPVQRTFLEHLRSPGRALVSANFPWDEETSAWHPVSLWRASLTNARQYLSARRGRVENRATALHRLAEPGRTFLLVGSCGLALLGALAPDPGVRARLYLFAYGAVGPRWPAGVAGTRVVGRRDPWARTLGPRDGPPAVAVAGGHMDYLASSEVVTLARAALDAWQTGARAP